MHESSIKKRTFTIYEVGPFYGIGVILLTIAGIVISDIGLLNSGMVHHTILRIDFITGGVLVAIGGFLVWKSAAVGKNCIDGYIESNTLCTTGIYGSV